MIFSDKRGARAISPWPGYVDVLSSLLMVVIFVVLIFTIAQFLLSEVLSGKESELTVLHRRVNELVHLLGLEKEQSGKLKVEVAEMSGLISDLSTQKETLSSRLTEQALASEQDRSRIKEQITLIGSLQEDIDALRRLRESLEAQVGSLSEALAQKSTEAGALRDRSKALEAQLADEKERTLLSQKEIEQSNIRIQALAALVGQQKQALEKERELSANARAEVALLNRQIQNMKQQLDEIGRALATAEQEKSEQQVQLKELGKRLNIELARRVNRLERSRSEFFGRLREILGNTPLVRIEGDRFVLQSELLFDSGTAVIGEQGRRELQKIAQIVLPLTRKLPADINWILRIDGHTDRVPIHNEQFSSNWELSTARALAVVQFLAQQGIPEERMAATGFSKYHPVDPADTLAAYRKNRRIEIKLTSR